MIYGYVRVSTEQQNLARQLEKMESLGIPEENVFADKASGRDMDRDEYRRLLSVLSEGDEVVIDSLDRLGRDYDMIGEEWRRITREVGADIRCLDLDFMDSSMFRGMGLVGRLMEDSMLSMLSYVAQAERDKNRQRQREGIEIARREGRYHGRKPIDTPTNLLLRLVGEERNGRSVRSCAEELGVSPRTYRRRRDALREGM